MTIHKYDLSVALFSAKEVQSRSGVPNPGYTYPKGYIYLPEGVHLRNLSLEGKIYLYILFISKYSKI